MRAAGKAGGPVLCLIAVALMLLAVPASAAPGSAQVRFVNAVPGAGPIDVSVGDRQVVSGLAFGRASDPTAVPSGGATIAFGDRGDPLVEGRPRLRHGRRYTVVATANGDPDLLAFRDGSGRPGRARIRIVQAADELGSPDVFLGSRRLGARVGYRFVLPYRSVEPGTYELQARKRDGGEDPLVALEGLSLAAGTASTAVLLGTSGERARVLVLSDGTFTPRGAPATGLGGLSDGSLAAWLAVLLAALAGGVLAGAGYRAAKGAPSRRARGG